APRLDRHTHATTSGRRIAMKCKGKGFLAKSSDGASAPDSRRERKPRHLWRSRILINTSLLVVLPLLIVGGSFSWLFFNDAQQNQITQNEDYLQMSVGRLEQAFSTIENQAAQWMRLNIGLTSIPPQDGIARDYLRQMRLVNSMEVQKHSNDWIERVIYRHGGSGMVLDSEYGDVISRLYPYWPLVSRLYDGGVPTGWWHFHEGTRGIFFVNWFPRNSIGEQDMLVVQLSEALLASEMNPLPGIVPGASFVLLDQQGRVMYPLEGAAALPDMLDPDALRPGAGSVLYQRDGAARIASYAQGMSGWTLVADGERGVVLSNAMIVWQAAMTIMVVGALVSVLCIVLFSRWIYSPFQKLLSTFGGEQAGDEEQEPMPSEGPPRQGASRQGRVVLDEVAFLQDSIASVQQQKSAYMDRWQALAQVAGQQYLQLLLRGDQYAALETLPDTFPREIGVIVCAMHLEDGADRDAPPLRDRLLAFGAIERIAQELLSELPLLQGHVLTQYPTGFTFVCFPAQDIAEAAAQDAVRRFGLELLDALEARLGIVSQAVSLGVGRLYAEHFDASLSYNEALMAMRYHLLGGNRREICFYADVVSDAEDISLHYPRTLEARILASLKESRMDAAREGLEAFGRQIQRSGSYAFCRQAYLLLLTGIIQLLVRDDRMAETVLRDNLLASFEQCVSLTKMQNFILRRVFPYFETLRQQEESDDAAERAVAMVQQYVQEHVTDDLSLQQCADRVGISASYLSRIFKRVSGMTFLEYVTSKKIAYVKDRLRDSQDNIGDIALEVGYSERNLYRTFVKLEQMSPGAYREKARRAM
ncbi:AraC family transcriptional regulator, partial [Eubacteriales bacterium OttesenSCG-928-A19]|nr:AraC family transcriptional regulator [Eubacteriales bacterium OttesenSCG-928-A19]